MAAVPYIPSRVPFPNIKVHMAYSIPPSPPFMKSIIYRIISILLLKNPLHSPSLVAVFQFSTVLG
jgi:hypothetical protein